MEMNGGSTVSYLARTLGVAAFWLILIGPDTKGRLDFQGRRGITSEMTKMTKMVDFLRV